MKGELEILFKQNNICVLSEITLDSSTNDIQENNRTNIIKIVNEAKDLLLSVQDSPINIVVIPVYITSSKASHDTVLIIKKDNNGESLRAIYKDSCSLATSWNKLCFNKLSEVLQSSFGISIETIDENVRQQKTNFDCNNWMVVNAFYIATEGRLPTNGEQEDITMKLLGDAISTMNISET